MALNKNERVAVFVAVVVAVGFLILAYSFFTGNNEEDKNLLEGLVDGTLIDTGAHGGDDGESMEETEGLKIENLTEGDGAQAAAGSLITVHYTGTLEDGTVFDSSVQRGTPFQFVLGSGQVIQGWELGFDGMKVGGVRRLTIAPDLAYGNNQVGPIPPGSTLIFEVELLDVEPSPQ